MHWAHIWSYTVVPDFPGHASDMLIPVLSFKIPADALIGTMVAITMFIQIEYRDLERILNIDSHSHDYPSVPEMFVFIPDFTLPTTFKIWEEII